MDRKAFVGIACGIAVVFSFLAGYLVSNADWFSPAKVSLLRFLHNEKVDEPSENKSTSLRTLESDYNNTTNTP